MKTPCVRVCSIDEATGWCAGCFRSPVEIAHWRNMPEHIRDMFMEKVLPGRRLIAQARKEATGG